MAWYTRNFFCNKIKRMNQDIVNTNSEGAYHGYVELHRWPQWLSCRGNWINDEPASYLEWHSFKETTYYIQ